MHSPAMTAFERAIATFPLDNYQLDPHGKDPHEPGAKLDKDKPRVDLVINGFPMALMSVAEVAAYGAAKYTEDGWKSVPDGAKRYTAAMDRHRLMEAMGYDHDAESGLLHAAHQAWNALARLELLIRDEFARRDQP